MFLATLYKHSKLLFLLFFIFIAGQLFVGYKHGMVASPFYNYGMYSQVFSVDSSYRVWEIRQNEKLLRGQDFSPEQWDRILLPLQHFAGVENNNKLYSTQVSRLLNKVAFRADSLMFVQACNYTQFEKWYSAYLSSITGKKTKSLAIVQRRYTFDGSKLAPTPSVIPLAALCN